MTGNRKGRTLVAYQNKTLMAAINILPCGAVRFLCPEDFRLLIEEKYGPVSVPKQETDEWIRSLKNADYVYEFHDYLVVMKEGAPLLPEKDAIMSTVSI